MSKTQTQIDLDMVIFWQREVDMDIHTQAVVSCWGPASTCGQTELGKLTVAKLKERLSKLGKRTSGNKATLVRRLLEAILETLLACMAP